MIPIKPYFIRAFFDWIVDNGWTPHLLVDATQPGVDVPRAYVVDDKIVLNVAPRAVRDLDIEREYVGFSARFGGVRQNIYIPIGALRAIYAEENGQGLTFPAENEPPTEEPTHLHPKEPPRTHAGHTKEHPEVGPKKGGRPNLRVVKDD